MKFWHSAPEQGTPKSQSYRFRWVQKFPFQTSWSEQFRERSQKRSVSHTQNDNVMSWKRFPHYWRFVKESINHRWIPITKSQYNELWCVLCCSAEESVGQTVELWVIWDTMALMWHQCNDILECRCQAHFHVLVSARIQTKMLAWQTLLWRPPEQSSGSPIISTKALVWWTSNSTLSMSRPVTSGSSRYPRPLMTLFWIFTHQDLTLKRSLVVSGRLTNGRSFKIPLRSSVALEMKESSWCSPGGGPCDCGWCWGVESGSTRTCRVCPVWYSVVWQSWCLCCPRRGRTGIL